MICTRYLAWIPLVIFQSCLKFQFCKTISKYHSWYLCQISLQIMLLPIRTNSVRGLYDKNKGLRVLFTWDVMRTSIFKRLVYTPPDSSPRFTSKLNLSNAKNRAWFFILASLLDRGMQRVNCFLKLYFGVVQSSIVSQTEQCWREWWMPHYDATANANTIHE